MMAAIHGYDSIVETLVTHGANVKLKDQVVIEINMMPK